MNPILLPFKAEHVRGLPPVEGHTPEGMIEMARRMEAWGPALTGIIDGVFIGAAGLGVYWPGVGEAWTLLTPQIKMTHKVWLTRTVKKFLNDIIRALDLHRVQIAVRASEDMNNRWAQALGFSNPRMLERYGPDKADFIQYTILR